MDWKKCALCQQTKILHHVVILKLAANIDAFTQNSLPLPEKTNCWYRGLGWV